MGNQLSLFWCRCVDWCEKCDDDTETSDEEIIEFIPEEAVPLVVDEVDAEWVYGFL